MHHFCVGGLRDFCSCTSKPPIDEFDVEYETNFDGQLVERKHFDDQFVAEGNAKKETPKPPAFGTSVLSSQKFENLASQCSSR